MAVADAAQLYSLLSVSDGLVARSALIVSAAGMVVTRTASGGELGLEISKQLSAIPGARRGRGNSPRCLFSLVRRCVFSPPPPGAPPLLAIKRGTNHRSRGERQPQKHDESGGRSLDLLELEVATRSFRWSTAEGAVVERIRALRRQFLNDKGFLVPQIHIRDNLRLASKQYVILIKGVEAGRGELRPGRMLAMNAGGAAQTDGALRGEATTEPAFGLPALWISAADRERAEMMGYTVVDPETVLITHISELVKRYGPELLTRQDVQRLLDGLAKDHPKVVEELIPHHLTLGGVQKVLQNLLREDVPIRDLLTIVESLADYAPAVKDADELTESVRQALARTIASSYRGPEGLIQVMTFDPQIERLVLNTTTSPGPPDSAVAEKLWRGQFPGTTRWCLAEPFRAEFHF
jgi:flagellar biosynthesis protein FlhA